ncbi:unnamed protein product [Protopolystoma xenopodis]|uniref:Uncharacterized protein n=1 Tax=Protopolystoma xenopodis TaxID=117903 RepID=A0A448WU23_9PLAT|nr:unnamed protein product [Protopolystoma xenopodis]
MEIRWKVVDLLYHKLMEECFYDLTSGSNYKASLDYHIGLWWYGPRLLLASSFFWTASVILLFTSETRRAYWQMASAGGTIKAKHYRASRALKYRGWRQIICFTFVWMPGQ